MPKLLVNDYHLGQVMSTARGQELCRALEEGRILYFPETPAAIPAQDLEFLLAQRQTGGQHHKNVAYRPAQDRVTGVADRSTADRLRQILSAYSCTVKQVVAELLRPYSAHFRRDYASFRPLQEKGRQIRVRARNDLLHVDSFPSRPTSGDRILRFFNNINPDAPRRWIIGEPLNSLLQHFCNPDGLRTLLESSRRGSAEQRLRRIARRAGLPVTARSHYDEFMLGLHHLMKEDIGFQRDSARTEVEFPPGSSWIVFTDSVPHAVLSGQYAIEQTLIIEREAMVAPELSPAHIVETLWESVRNPG